MVKNVCAIRYAIRMASATPTPTPHELLLQVFHGILLIRKSLFNVLDVLYTISLSLSSQVHTIVGLDFFLKIL